MAQKPALSATQHSLLKIAVWTVLFQIAWGWKRLATVLDLGELGGPDDFLRLHQIQNWMAGQGWFDLSVMRMFPPDGADIHWSRLVDVPIAAMILFFNVFFEQELAARLATAIWPTLLLIAVVIVLTRICDRLIPNYNRLLPLLFAVLCISSLAEFRPGRIDHHNIQILLFTLVILGLVNRDTRWGDYLMGAAMALSISIGLDVAALFVLILAFLGYEWAAGHDVGGRGLRRLAISIAGSSLILYLLNFAPENYLDSHCDANSLVYLSALLLLAFSFVSLSFLSASTDRSSSSGRFILRLVAGGIFGIASVAILLSVFPQCADGPYGQLSEQAVSRWKIGRAHV